MTETAEERSDQGVPIAVVIPHYEDVVRLSRCLNALAPQCDGAVEIVVVDNASKADLGPVRTAHPNVVIVVEPRRGAAAARNRGAAETHASSLAFLDADCIPAADWIARARDAAVPDTVVGGRIDVFDETPPPRTGPQAFETAFAFRQRDYVERKGFSVTANLVTTRAVFARTGPMVPGLSEDVDWCRRAVAGGARLVYDDTLVVQHPTRADWPSLKRKWRRLTDEMFSLNGATPSARARWALRGFAMTPAAVVQALRLWQHPGLDRRERWRGLRTLMGLRLVRAGWMLRQAVMGRPR